MYRSKRNGYLFAIKERYKVVRKSSLLKDKVIEIKVVGSGNW